MASSLDIRENSFDSLKALTQLPTDSALGGEDSRVVSITILEVATNIGQLLPNGTYDPLPDVEFSRSLCTNGGICCQHSIGGCWVEVCAPVVKDGGIWVVRFVIAGEGFILRYVEVLPPFCRFRCCFFQK